MRNTQLSILYWEVNKIEACDGEVEGHQSAETAEHELLDSSDLSDLTESEPEYSGPQSIFLIKFRNFHTFLKDTFLSSKSAQELKMSIPTYQPKGPRQKRLETASPALDYFGYKIESSPPKGLFSKLIGYLKPQSAMSKIEKDGLTESTLAYTPHGLIMAKILKNSVEYFKFEH
ncbi:hypothetical protein LENED_009952 [Lentinula edodes]|uniref:Uncharacterized protein n=1 Tax=Lentinula edodes TaxID=5353 RepID=A0A1Q3EL31_LENED|nr:hypothetical protein LENED_009952 [Lentinula edodes]